MKTMILKTPRSKKPEGLPVFINGQPIYFLPKESNMPIALYDYQLDAVERLRSGCILCGGVGSGKSRTSLAYYFAKECGGKLDADGYSPMLNPKNLCIITTARKRDTKEWEGELAPFLLSTDKESCFYKDVDIRVDSWNNIQKYADVKDTFFIFDEQRVVGSGAWVKAFLKIAKSNHWILLSATPGDTWTDYIPVFLANGFYKNKTEFVTRHVVYSRFSKFPKVDRYLDQSRLMKLRNKILINMDYTRPTHVHHETINVDYNRMLYKEIMAKRWNIYEDMPIVNAAELCYVARKAINSDESRIKAIIELCKDHPKLIVFYNYDYELDILREADYGEGVEVAEWNGHKHEHIPLSDKWVYLVQYTAGAEGWNCIDTDTIVFYSLNYSYKIMVQSAGRIDRMNTPFTDLYYYRLKSSCPLDLAISRALKQKQNFNERRFCIT